MGSYYRSQYDSRNSSNPRYRTSIATIIAILPTEYWMIHARVATANSDTIPYSLAHAITRNGNTDTATNPITRDRDTHSATNPITSCISWWYDW